MRPPLEPLIRRLREQFTPPFFSDPRTRPQAWRQNRKLQSVVEIMRRNARRQHPANRSLRA